MSGQTKQVNIDLRVGDKFETVYPFIFITTDYQSYNGDVITDERWIGGCHKRFEAADCGYGEQPFYTADAEGKRILEVLSIADMPGNGRDESFTPAILLILMGERGREGKHTQ